MKTIYKNKKSINEPLEFKGGLIRETEKAFLFYFEARDEELWIPKSQVLALKTGEPSDIIYISTWIAEMKNLLEEKPPREPGEDDNKGDNWEDDIPF